jgi:3-phenylpropionate/trans-cinnamate dioxygenase ferredoxin subunit
VTIPEDDQSPDLLAEIEQLIAELQTGHGVDVGEKTTRMLQDIDAVHRAGLSHLMDAIRSMGGDAFINRLIADPAIRVLLMSYDLIPVDRRLMAEEALDMVRGHLHFHGVDVEILEVVGGVVYVRIHGLAATELQEDAVVHDLEEALKARFIGFQELVNRERTSEPKPIPIGGIRRPHRPVYKDALDVEELAAGCIRAVDIDGTSILIARVGDDHYAILNRCGDSPLPLEYSSLEGAQLTCSWHGCRYDVRTGARLDADAGRVRVFPVRVEAGSVRIAVDVEAVPGSTP